VIGGLLFGTFASLFLVPIAFAAVRGFTHRHKVATVPAAPLQSEQL
jgi:hypothetical protein